MDCFRGLRNPYIPVDVPNPTMAQENQRKLTGEGSKERKEIFDRIEKIEDKIYRKKKLKDEEESAYKEMMEYMADDIFKERKRIGGDWVIAGCLLSNRQRDVIR